MKTEELERSLVSSPAAVGAPGLLLIRSPDAALANFFPLEKRSTIGRRDEPEAPEIAVADGGVSRAHAAIHWRSDGSGCEVRDLGSRNGTFVDGRQVRSEVAPIGSVIRTGDTFFEVSHRPVETTPVARLLGRSAALMRLTADVHRVAQSDATLLIEGETGTGKELVAEAIHELSGRPGQLVAINCASIPPSIAESYLFGHKKGAFTGASSDAQGVFEQANEGTLFLDEIGELRLDLQAKLLRVLETREYSPVGSAAPRLTTARFLSATNARLRVQIASGTFRSDLFARLAGLEIEVPSLRRRRSDIPLLMQHFFADLRFELSANALESLLLHPWPMNVRELKTVCGRLALSHPGGGVLRSADVAAVMNVEEPRAPASPESSAPTRTELTSLLEANHGNVLKLAAHYGKDCRQIYRWLELHGLDPRDFR